MKKRIIILAGILAVLFIASGCSSKNISSHASGTTQGTTASTTPATTITTTATTSTTSNVQTTAPVGDFTKEQALDTLKNNVEVVPGGMFAFDHIIKENGVEYYMFRYYDGSGTIAWFDVQKDNGKIFILNIVTNKLVEYIPNKTSLYNPQ